MPALSVIKNYADNTVLTQQQLNQAFESIEQFLNNTKIDAQNIQSSSITATELAANAVVTDKIQDAAITLDKLATEILNRLMPAGTLIASGATVPPQGYLYCNGAAVSRTVFINLFNAIGTAYGAGDGFTTFNVPETRGWFLRGQNDATGYDPDAGGRYALTAGGNTGDAVGSHQDGEMGLHNHGGGAHAHGVSDPTHAHGVSHNARALAGGGQNVTAGGGTESVPIASVSVLAAATGISINGSGVINASQGGNENRPKNVAVRYYIKT